MSLNAKSSCVPVEDLKLSPQDKYEVLEFLGEGGFGSVLKAQNLRTNEFVALKTLDEENIFSFQKELQMLEMTKQLDPDVFNIIRYIEHTEVDGIPCIAFEILDENVEELMTKEFSFSLHEIRPIAKQLLTTLLGLKSIGVMHLDIKPENIMLVNQVEQPYRVKLIDFGVARPTSQVEIGEMIQPIEFRAPEVTLGLPVSEAAEMWGLARCLLLWYLGFRNLASYSEFDNLTMMVHILGTPPAELLSKGMYTERYFVQEESKWRLKTLQEYKYSTGKDPEMYLGRETAPLEELIKYPLMTGSSIQSVDKEAFYDLLKKMFEMNPKKRITPAEALLHPFITMDHLPEDKSYTEVAHQYMCVAETNVELLKREELQRIIEIQNMASHETPVERDIHESEKSSLSSGMEYNSDSYLSSTDSVYENNTVKSLFNMTVKSSSSPESKYKVLEFLGKGCFGEVAKGRNKFTKEVVALKFLKQDKNTAFYFQKELQMLDMIAKLNPDIFNIITLIEHFEFDGRHCLAFEILDMTVDSLMTQQFYFSLHEIRPMAKQLLTTLLGLQSIGVLHSDIKPDNIMLVNHVEQPFKVKLIDFGVALHVSQLEIGMTMQPFEFRAPEVTLGLPLSEAVDMWSLGRCLIFWYLGKQNLRCYSEFDYLSMIVDMLGTPPDELLKEGLYTNKFFVQEESKWRLKTLQEFKDFTSNDPNMYVGRETSTLEELIKDPDVSESGIVSSDKDAFYDLLKKMFEMNPRERITPAEALLHPFITMDHLPQEKCYTKEAHQYMCVAETDFKPLQREGLQNFAEMCIAEREKARVARELSTPESNLVNLQNAPSQDDSGDNATSCGILEISNSSGYLPIKEDDASLPKEELASMKLSYEAANVGRQEKSSGEISIGSPCISNGLLTIEEWASDEPVQDTMRKPASLQNPSSATYESNDWRDTDKTEKNLSSFGIMECNSKASLSEKYYSESKEVSAILVVSNTGCQAKFLGEHSNGLPRILGGLPTTEGDSDLKFAAFLEAAKEELPVDCSEILEDIENLFQDEEATEAHISEVKKKASKSMFSRIRALFSRLLNRRPKKPFLSKPKWVKHIPIFPKRSTRSGPSAD